MDTAYLSPAALAARLSLDRRTIYRAIESGDLRAVRIGNRIRIAESSVDAWLHRADL